MIVTGPTSSAGYAAENQRPVRWQLTDVFVRQLVGQTDPLRLVLDRLAVHNGVLELLNDGLVDGIALSSLVSLAIGPAATSHQ